MGNGPCQQSNCVVETTKQKATDKYTWRLSFLKPKIVVKPCFCSKYHGNDFLRGCSNCGHPYHNHY